MVNTKNKAKKVLDRYAKILKTIKIINLRGANKVLKKRDGFVSKYVEELAKKEGYL